MLLAKHRGPLAADLHRYHGLRLARIQESGFSVVEVADFAGNLPPDGAVARSVNPDWAIRTETLLLREIEHGIRVLAWQQTADGSAKQPKNHPVPLPLTKAEIEAQEPKREYDVMSIDEANEFLGWPAA